MFYLVVDKIKNNEKHDDRVCVPVCARVRARVCMCARVCVCERERERERESVCFKVKNKEKYQSKGIDTFNRYIY